LHPERFAMILLPEFLSYQCRVVAVLSLPLLLCACGSTALAPVPPNVGSAADDTARINARSRAIVAPAPAAIVEQVAASAGLAPQQVAGLVEWREADLAPLGPRVVMTRGRGPLCVDENCPLGVFAQVNGEYTPILLTRGEGEPRVWPSGHLGFPDLTVNTIESPRDMRITRFQWDGTGYDAASCRIQDRLGSASRACEPAHASDVAVRAATPAALCGSMRRMIDTHPAAARTRVVIEGAFVARADAGARVEVLKLRGAGDPQRITAVLQCLRTRVGTWRDARVAGGARNLATRAWTATAVRTPTGLAAVQVTSTPVKRLNYTLVSVGVFARPAIPEAAAAMQ
jgi:hypothetical protein